MKQQAPMLLREILLLAAFGVIPTAVLLIVALSIFGSSIDQWLSTSDAPSYVAVAKHIFQNVRSSEPWDERVFPGWAILIGACHAIVSPNVACIALALVFAGLLPILVFSLTRDFSVSIACCLWPVWILQAALGMSEPAFLLFILLSMLLIRWRMVSAAGICMGFAAVIRPLALFPWIAVLLNLWFKKAPRSVLIRWIVLSGIFAGMTVPLNVYLYGSPLRQFERYSTLPNTGVEAVEAGLVKAGDGHFGIPFKSLIETPIKVRVPAWKIIYIYAHLAVVLVACVNAVRFWNEGEQQPIWAVWGLLNTMFIVSTGPYWGFHSFDRYCVWAMPAYVMLCRRYLPKSLTVWAGIAVVTTLIAISARWTFLAAQHH